MDDSGSTVAVSLTTILLGVSVAACLRLAKLRQAGRPLLPLRPRRPAPWGGWAAALVVGPMLINLADGVFSQPELPALAETASQMAPMQGAAPGVVTGPATRAMAAALDALAEQSAGARFAADTWLMVAVLLALTAAIYAALALVCRADRRDLGWPGTWPEVNEDIRIGAVGALAALAPVVICNAALDWLLQPETQHPFFEHALANPSPSVLLAMAAAALAAAPLFEETTYRLLLQGWLERIEHEHAPPADVEWEATGRAAAPGLLGLPRGWTPILVSATLFGLAHWGHGVSPAPLILLGAVLGYVYYRTHRILPCIVLHMLFNAVTMLNIALVAGA